MDNPTHRSMWDRTTTAQIARWLFSRRTIRRFLLGLAWMATIIALIYGEENWRGRHAWNKYRRELEARGEQLDLRAFIPKPIPDNQNFAATPFVQSWFPRGEVAFEGDSYSLAGPRFSGPEKDKGNRHFRDLNAWATAFAAVRSGDLMPHPNKRRPSFVETQFDLESRVQAASAVLEGLKANEAAFTELRAVSRRPYSRFPVIFDLENPWGILLPHLALIKFTCQRLQLNACAELASSHSDRAWEDVKLMLRLADSLKDEPFLISYRVRVACVLIASQPIWEGLAEHRWTEAQLQDLQTRLQQPDFVTDLKRPLDAERAAGILTVELVRKKGLGYLNALSGDESAIHSDTLIANLLSPMIPSGWYYQEHLNYCRLLQTRREGASDPAKWRISPTGTVSASREVAQTLAEGGRIGKVLRHRVFAALLGPDLFNVISSTAKAQICTDQATLACAMERCRLASGQFPENLDALVPRFISALPHDVITGEPYKYRRTEDGQFVLYSVGWNEKDDGGVTGNVLFDEKQGDWVWCYPSK